MNGLMIDSARLLEKHEYYYRLIDFMCEWNMNTLLFHFSDDHGLSIKIPGYEKLARPHAFTPEEISQWIDYASRKGVDVIPELEVFGHTRYITDHPDYRHLFLGDPEAKITFNAINPLKPETTELMHDMIKQVAAIFPSSYFHLGCDEVNLSNLKLQDDAAEADVWATYVNNMITYTTSLGKQAMIWDDHLKKNDLIADLINKDVILVDWNYDPDYRPENVFRLQEKGFDSIIMAPSISCWRNRMIPSKPQLKNVDIHAEQVQNGKAMGMINTVWLPMRYLQNSMWYGMAYGSYLINRGQKATFNRFNRVFARKTFGLTAQKDVPVFLDQWASLHFDRSFFSAIVNDDYRILNNDDKIDELKEIHRLSAQSLALGRNLSPKKNKDIFDSMILSAEIINVLSEAMLIMAKGDDPGVLKQDCLGSLQRVIDLASAEWDAGRYADDPAKFKAKFPNQENSHLLIVLRKLQKSLTL